MKIPGDNLLGSPGVGRQPEREQVVQLMPVLCGDQIRTAGEMQELVRSLFLLVEGKSQGSAHILEGLLSPKVREEEKEEPRGQQWIRHSGRASCRPRRPGSETHFCHLLTLGGPLSSLCLRTFDCETPSHQVGAVRVR